MKNRKRLIILFTIISILLTGCNSTKKEQIVEVENNKEVSAIKLGCMPMTEPIISALKEGLEDYGHEVEVMVFDGSALPATALKEGNIDGMVLNYLPWVKTFNKENNANLEMVEPYIYYGYSGIYSTKHKSIEDIPENGVIAVANDPTNLEKALIKLEGANLIKLGDKKGNFYNVLDIVENPKNIEILETEVTSVIRNINDVDAVLCTAVQLFLNDMEPEECRIYPDDSVIEEELEILAKEKEAGIDEYQPLYVAEDFGIVVQPSSLEEQWVKDSIEVYLGEEFRKKFNDYYKGAFILYEH